MIFYLNQREKIMKKSEDLVVQILDITPDLSLWWMKRLCAPGLSKCTIKRSGWAKSKDVEEVESSAIHFVQWYRQLKCTSLAPSQRKNNETKAYAVHLLLLTSLNVLEKSLVSWK